MGATIAEGTDKVLSKDDKSKSMSDTTFMQDNLPEVFDPRRYGSVKAAQIAAYDFMKGRVQKKLKLRRIRQLWEGKASRVDGEEKDALRQAKIEEARNEYKALRSRLASLEAALAAVDEDFHGPQMDAYRASATGLGRSDCPRNHRE
jgi:BMFP domain-containing protein YqiC